MLLSKFDELPDTARVWVYGLDKELGPEAEPMLLNEVDGFLKNWSAHGEPLSAAREWREKRFLTVAVDQDRAGASGCSIDGLFRALKSLEPKIGASIVTSGLVFFRGKNGRIRAVTRDEFGELGSAGEVDGDTEVFDPSVTTMAEWRGRFASRVADSWHASLIPARAG